MKVVVIGGGPAGILAAYAASKAKNEVTLLEKNEKLGKKLFITGKGRCNVTNACEKEDFFKNIVRNPKFMFSSFSQFSNVDFQNLIEDNGCKLKVERGNRVFPDSDKSYDVIDAFKQVLRKAKVNVKLYTEVKTIIQTNDKRFEVNVVETEIKDNSKSEYKIFADKVIIATGGLSYASTGSTGDGYRFAKNFGIKVIDQSPSLVPLEVIERDDCVNMQGLSLKNVSILVYKEKDGKREKVYSDFGEMLFTHFGLSGPIILSASCYIDDYKDNNISIDLKPALSEEKLDDRLLREFDENKKKALKSIIELLLPSSMIIVFLDRLGKKVSIDFDTLALIKASEVDKHLRKEIVSLLKDFKFTIKGKRGFDEAIITKGGIDVKEINPKTMESSKVKGLYFAGEVLDVDCLTGGFNITVAASTGFVAGVNIV